MTLTRIVFKSHLCYDKKNEAERTSYEYYSKKPSGMLRYMLCAGTFQLFEFKPVAGSDFLYPA
jgi:hypothetical protein